MKLLQLNIKNFRSFKEATFNFYGAGLYFLAGENQVEPRLGANGAGKSSVWDALCWLFWGKTLRGLKAGDVANWEAGGDVSVSLSYKAGGAGYQVTRTWNPNSWKINLLGSFEQTDLVDDETNLLWSHLKLNYLAATHCIFMAQQQPMFLDLPAKDKAALFSEVMELDKWLEYSERATKMANAHATLAMEQERQITSIDGQIQGLTALDFKKDMVGWEDGRKSRLASLEQEYEACLDMAKDSKQGIKLETEQIRIMEDALAKHQKVEVKCKTCGQRINDNEYSEMLRDLTDHQQRLNSKKRNLKDIERDIDKIELDVASIERERNPFAGKQQDVKNRLEILEGQKDVCVKWLDEVQGKKMLFAYWIQGFKDLRLRLIAESLQQLEIETNSSLLDLGLIGWEIHFSVDRETKGGSIQRGFNVMIRSPYNETQTQFESWSGGESQRLRLAAQMGLSNLIRSTTGTTINLEVWDEISNYLNAQGILDFLDTMKNRASTNNLQTWIIDHHVLGYNNFDGIVTIVKDASGSYLKEYN